jgi:hypothetical protein
VKNPDWWEDPPEDPPEAELTEVACEGVGDHDRFFEIEIEPRDCDYWRKLE